MAHIHSVYDSDIHFSINPVTRTIKNESGKVTLIQHDHNSERFTFEIPRKVEEHDMSLCNKVQVHFINIDSSTKEKHSDIYEVDDLQISPESDDIVICSWLVSGNATQFVGSLNFVIRFSCVTDDGTIEYAWNTAVHSGISVSSGIYNSDVIYEEHFDVLEQWKAEINQSFDSLNESIANNTLAIKGEISVFGIDTPDGIYILRKGTEPLFKTNEYNDSNEVIKTSQTTEFTGIPNTYKAGVDSFVLVRSEHNNTHYEPKHFYYLFANSFTSPILKHWKVAKTKQVGQQFFDPSTGEMGYTESYHKDIWTEGYFPLYADTPTDNSSSKAVANKEYVDNLVGDINTALDSIIAIQNQLIGGDGE